MNNYLQCNKTSLINRLVVYCIVIINRIQTIGSTLSRIFIFIINNSFFQGIKPSICRCSPHFLVLMSCVVFAYLCVMSIIEMWRVFCKKANRILCILCLAFCILHLAIIYEAALFLQLIALIANRRKCC